MSEVLLSVDAVTMQFGGVTALDNVSLHINKGEILGLIGPCLLYTSPSPRD